MGFKARDISDRGKVTVEDFNQLAEQVESLNVTGVDPITVSQDSAGIIVSISDDTFNAILTSSYSPYKFQEVMPDGTGGWVTIPGGRCGTNAFESNGVLVGINTVVLLTPGIAGEYLFTYCCGNASSSSSSSSSAICIPFIEYVSCYGGGLQVVQKYLYITLPMGSSVTVRDTPCGGSGS